MKRAVFLDRDGVINKLVLNPKTSEYESPLSEDDLKIAPEVFSDLKKLNQAGFLLFIVSNQPNYAKGKASLESLYRINQSLSLQMTDHGIEFSEYFYCYHHPNGVVKEYSGECLCRKPKPYFLMEARKKYDINMDQSWMVGDQDTDVRCGQAAGVKTVLINEPRFEKKRKECTPDHQAINLSAAVRTILEDGGMPEIKDLKIKIFADGADKAGMLEMYAKPLIKGLTTNPTLMNKAGITDYRVFAKDILAVIKDKPISFEVFSDDFKEMERQALEIASWGDNVYVKIPITNTKREICYDLVKRLAAQKIKLNITAVMTLEQITEVAATIDPYVPSFVSVFAGRIADTGRDPVPMMTQAVKILKAKPAAELIWASPRELLNIFQADTIGCQVITVTHDILKKLSMVGYDLSEYSLDTVKMFHQDALTAKYKI